MIETPLQMIQKIVALISRYQAEGVLREEPPLHTVASLIGPLIYTEVLQTALPMAAVQSVEASTHVHTFLRGHLQNMQI